jgi:hypothetical protein
MQNILNIKARHMKTGFLFLSEGECGSVRQEATRFGLFEKQDKDRVTTILDSGT